MGKRVRVNKGFIGVYLGDLQSGYDEGDELVLTDAQFERLTTGVQTRVLTVLDANVPDPVTSTSLDLVNQPALATALAPLTSRLTTLEAAGGGGAKRLAVYTFNPSPGANLSSKALAAGVWTTASPANEAAITFIPPGAEVLLVWDTSAWSSSGDYHFGALTTAGVLVPGTEIYVANGTPPTRRHLERRVAVTPGTQVTWVWGQYSPAAVTGYPAAAGGLYGPATFAAWTV